MFIASLFAGISTERAGAVVICTHVNSTEGSHGNIQYGVVPNLKAARFHESRGRECFITLGKLILKPHPEFHFSSLWNFTPWTEAYPW